MYFVQVISYITDSKSKGTETALFFENTQYAAQLHYRLEKQGD